MGDAERSVNGTDIAIGSQTIAALYVPVSVLSGFLWQSRLTSLNSSALCKFYAHHITLVYWVPSIGLPTMSSQLDHLKRAIFLRWGRVR